MISLKKYMDSAQTGPVSADEPVKKGDLPVALGAYRAALEEMGKCSVNVSPALGEELKHGLEKVAEALTVSINPVAIAATEAEVREQLQNWGRKTVAHNQKQTGEVKDILLMMARTAESVGTRDQRCAQQIDEVTTSLKAIANLDDLTQIRTSIRKSALELKTSIERMTAEGKAVLDKLRTEVSTYQTKLEEAESIASRDCLTGVLSRFCMENQIEKRLQQDKPFCVAIIDIDRFKKVNDEHGHLIGDELLKQFATEMKSASRSTDLTGRWGGDEFLLMLDCELPVAQTQIERLQKWVCGDYTLKGNGEPLKLRVDASIGLAEHQPGETLKVLVDRADAEMYQRKAVSRKGGSESKH